MPSAVTLTSGPWQGVYDNITEATQSEQYAQNAFNVYLQDGAFWARPGFRIEPSIGASALGTVSGRRGQCLHWHVATDGTITRFVVCGGKIYRYGGDVSSSAPLVDVTPTSVVTISLTNRVYMTSFGDSILVNDETNRPWIMSSLTATNVTGAYIDLDSAASGWVARGPATIYGAKAFFILVSIAAGTYSGTYGNTIVWSEENSPTTGYRQTNFANFWQLTQTSNEQIYAIAGTEQALYYFREDSIGAIAGKVNSDFVAASTQDTVTLIVGTKYPATVVQTDRHIYFADKYGKPHRFALGGAPEPIWQAMSVAYRSETLVSGSDLQFSSLATAAQAAYHPDLGVVLYSLWAVDSVSNQYAAQRLYCFNAETGAYCGIHAIGASTAPALPTPTLSGRYIDAIGVLVSDLGFPMLCVLGTDTTTLSTAHQGWFWVQIRLNLREWVDVNAAGGALDTHIGVVSQLMPDEADVEFRADAVVAEIVGKDDTHTMALSYMTPRSTSAVLSATATLSTDQASTLGRGRAVFGMGPNAQGRWIRYLETYNVATTGVFAANQTALTRLSARGAVVPASPLAP